MQRLFEFIGHHPYLATAAVVAAAAVAFYEIRERMQAFAALTAMQAVRLMNQGALVIDLRGKELYDAGHIGEARNVPVAELESQADSLKKWRDKNVITYCDSGTSGASGARTLTKLGFSKVFNLQGGLNAWLKDNLPLAKTPGAREARSDSARRDGLHVGLVSLLSAGQRLADSEECGVHRNQCRRRATASRGNDCAQQSAHGSADFYRR